MVNREKLFKLYQLLYLVLGIGGIIMILLSRNQVIDEVYTSLYILFIVGFTSFINAIINYKDKKTGAMMSMLMGVMSLVAFVYILL